MNQCLDCDVLRLAGHFPFNTGWSEENARKMRVIYLKSEYPIGQKALSLRKSRTLIVIKPLYLSDPKMHIKLIQPLALVVL